MEEEQKQIQMLKNIGSKLGERGENIRENNKEPSKVTNKETHTLCDFFFVFSKIGIRLKHTYIASMHGLTIYGKY